MCILSGELLSGAPFQAQDVSSFRNIHQMVPSYQKFGFRLWNFTLLFRPADELQKSDACQGAVKTQKAGKNESPGEWGRLAYNIFISENMEQKSSVLFVVGQRLAECGPES